MGCRQAVTKEIAPGRSWRDARLSPVSVKTPAASAAHFYPRPCAIATGKLPDGLLHLESFQGWMPRGICAWFILPRNSVRRDCSSARTWIPFPTPELPTAFPEYFFRLASYGLVATLMS